MPFGLQIFLTNPVLCFLKDGLILNEKVFTYTLVDIPYPAEKNFQCDKLLSICFVMFGHKILTPCLLIALIVCDLELGAG